MFKVRQRKLCCAGGVERLGMNRNKIIVLFFVLMTGAVLLWMFRHQFINRTNDAGKYTVRHNILTGEECYFIGELKRPQIELLGLPHCAMQ